MSCETLAKFSIRGIMALGALWAGAAAALPVAQLDINGNNVTWDATTQTVVTSDPAFTLYGYGNTPSGNGKTLDTSLDWYLSIAIAPQVSAAAAATTDFGTFSVNGTTFDASNFVFGTPPLDTFLGNPTGNLAGHGIYDTLYTTLGVAWDPNQTRSAVDVQTTQGSNPSSNPGNALMYVGWDFNVSGLAAGFNLHFDLFGASCSGTTLSTTNCTVVQFAPFSHDAQTSVPEPEVLTLLGFGLLLVGVATRRRRRIS